MFVREGSLVHTSADVVLLTEIDEDVALRVLVLLGKTDAEIEAFLDRRAALEVHSPS